MKYLSIALYLIACSNACVFAAWSQPPNIVLVVADDHAQWAMSSYGMEALDTPNLDWLARRGTQFDNAMSPAPVCSPARATLLTGKMPSQHGVHDFLSEQEEFDADWLAGETLLQQRLQAAGYRTGHFGKWHATTDSRPPQRGFDEWLSYDARRAGWQNQYQHTGEVAFSHNGKAITHTGTQARHLTSEAIRFVDQKSDKPFYVSLNYVEPHFPFSGLPQRLVDRYRAMAQELVAPGDHSDMTDRGQFNRTPEDHAEQLAQYLAAVSLIDDQIGHLLDALQGRNLLDNTVLVYVSDHGLLMGQYGLYGKTNATNPANFYEETLRIPLIVYGPEVRAGQRRKEFVDLIDLHATLLDFATGGTLVRSVDGPGQSARPLLRGVREAGWRTLQFAERGASRMVTDGRYKLVRRHHRDTGRPPEETWYDLTHPLGERHAVSPPRDAERMRLANALTEFFDQYETPEHSGRTVWDQPRANARQKRDLAP